MKAALWKIIALILTVAVLISGCGLLNIPVSFGDMVYTRPDMDSLEQKLAAVEEILPEATSAKQIMPVFYEFYFEYESFATNYALAYIRYCQNLTDIYWEQEYNYCLEHTTWVDASYDQLLYALADTPCVEELESGEYFGPGFFDEYQGESLWDDNLMALIGRQDDLLSQYYALSAEQATSSPEYYEGTGRQIAEVFVEMIALRQEIADYAGYPDYPSFAYDFYHARDYTPLQAAQYMEGIRTHLVPLYRQAALQEQLSGAYDACSQEQTLAYVSDTAKNMGGIVREAYDIMTRCDLYDITQSENKYDASFEVYLYSYQLPFIFVNSTGMATDKLTLTHEFGHFCRDYAAYGYGLSIDVAEFFSQGLEYLSLFYAADGAGLEAVKMNESLCVYVEQAAYASFEQQVYDLKGSELTVENVDALFTDVMADFGMDIWGVTGRAYVRIPHFFISPMYVISYIVSNDAAMQIYQMEKAESGAGKAVYEQSLSTQEMYFLAFAEDAGLEDPFAPRRLEAVRDTLEAALIP